MADSQNCHTEPLPNGSELPTHPDGDTGLRITSYGPVKDSTDGTVLHIGLHRSELSMLMAGNKMALGHTYSYAVINNHIYHTRQSVVIACTCVKVEP